MTQIGRFLELDAEGFLTNPGRSAPIQAEWRPLLDALVQACRRVPFLGLYVRGSVASGTAVPGSSDLDSVIVLDDDEGERRPEWPRAVAADLMARFPFVTDVEVVVVGRGALRRALADPDRADPVMAQWCFLLALWGRCLEGTDVLPELGRFRPGAGVAYVLRSLPQDLRTFERKRDALLAAPPSPGVDEDARRLIVWTSKKLLRAGAELAMVRDGRFTRDLGPCARRMGELRPEWAEPARQLLAWAISPAGRAGLEALGQATRALEPAIVQAGRALGVEPIG